MAICADARIAEGAIGEARSARAFAAARRHSALVRGLRVALPSAAVVTLVALGALGLYRAFGAAIGRVSVDAMSIDGTKIAMDKPRLTGARKGGDSYVITAAKAIQDLARPTQIDLVAIEGDIGAADHDTLHMSASTGHYDTQRESLGLAGVVRLRNSRYTVALSHAQIDFKAGAYVSPDPVSVMFGIGNSITADSASGRDNGQEITFEGHVRSIFRVADGAGDAIRGAGP